VRTFNQPPAGGFRVHRNRRKAVGRLHPVLLRNGRHFPAVEWLHIGETRDAPRCHRSIDHADVAGRRCGSNAAPIGIAEYRELQGIVRPVGDARAVHDRLSQLDFSSELVVNADAPALQDAFNRFTFETAATSPNH
jgi:hypothetical protein